MLPSPIPTGGITGPTSITDAWNSAAFDPTRGLFFVHGGGHGDYPGNEVYAFDVGAGKWSLYAPPSYSYPVPGADEGNYPDGTPTAVHTYGGLVYAPAPADALLRFGGSKWGNGGASTSIWALNLGSKKWTRPGMTPSANFLGETTAWDPSMKVVWHRVYNTLQTFDPATGVSVDNVAQPDEGLLDGHNMVFDPKRRLLLVFGVGYSFAYRVDDPRPLQRIPFPTTGANAIVQTYAPALEYDPDLDRIVGWNGGAPLVLDVDARQWSTLSMTGTAPQPSENGTWGRFRRVGYLKYITVSSIDQNVFAVQINASTTVASAPSSATPASPSVPAPSPAPTPVVAPMPTPAPTVTPTTSVTAPPVSTVTTVSSAGAWTAVPLPAVGQGPMAVTISGKHSRLLWDTKRARLVHCCGDTNGSDAGNNEIWASAGSAWQKLAPMCASPGDAVPSRPDNVGWAYDEARDRYIVIPGFFFGAAVYYTYCPAGALNFYDGGVFDPITNKWSRAPWSAPSTGYGGDEGSTYAVYDRPTDAVYRFYWDGAWGTTLQVLSLATNTWETRPLGQTPYSEAMRNLWIIYSQITLDSAGRALYVFAQSSADQNYYLLRYGIDSKTAELIPTPSAYTPPPPMSEPGGGVEVPLVFDPDRRLVIHPQIPNLGGEILRLYIYKPDSHSWVAEDIPNKGVVAGQRVLGNVFGYDRNRQAMVVMGGHAAGPAFLDLTQQTASPTVYWLYRFGN